MAIERLRETHQREIFSNTQKSFKRVGGKRDVCKRKGSPSIRKDDRIENGTKEASS